MQAFYLKGIPHGLFSHVLCHCHGAHRHYLPENVPWLYPPLPTLACLGSYGLCFFSFSRALTSLNLALAYATWSGVGILATTFISWFFFGEKLTATGMLAIFLIIAGCVLLNFFGTKS